MRASRTSTSIDESHSNHLYFGKAAPDAGGALGDRDDFVFAVPVDAGQSASRLYRSDVYRGAGGGGAASVWVGSAAARAVRHLPTQHPDRESWHVVLSERTGLRRADG